MPFSAFESGSGSVDLEGKTPLSVDVDMTPKTPKERSKLIWRGMILGDEQAKDELYGARPKPLGGPHPLMEGIGGPAKAGASLIANSGKIISGAKKLSSARKLPSLAGIGKKTKSASKSIDLVPRLASSATAGELPHTTAKNTWETIRDWEAPKVSLPADEPEPKTKSGPDIPIAVYAVGGLGAILLINEVTSSGS